VKTSFSQLLQNYLIRVESTKIKIAGFAPSDSCGCKTIRRRPSAGFCRVFRPPAAVQP
jgi:hypothetical protein